MANGAFEYLYVYVGKELLPQTLQFFRLILRRQQDIGVVGGVDITYGYPDGLINQTVFLIIEKCSGFVVGPYGPEPSRQDLHEMTSLSEWVKQGDGEGQVQMLSNGTGLFKDCFGRELNAWDQQQQAEWRQQSLYALFMLVGICLLGAILLTGLAFVLVGIKPKIYALLEETGLDQRLSNFIDAVNSFLENASQKAQQLAQTARETADSAKERVNLLGQKFRLYGHRDQGGYVELVDERGIRKTVTRINESEPGTPTPGTPRASHFGSS